MSSETMRVGGCVVAYWDARTPGLTIDDVTF